MPDNDEKEFKRRRLEQIRKQLEVYVADDTDGEAMAGPTREEIDAKLALVEARTETRFTELSGKLDRLVESIGSIRTEVKDEGKLTRWTIIGLVIAGLAALWVTQSNMLASFSAGIAVHEAQKPSTPKPQQ